MCCSSPRPRILGVGLACLDYLFLSPPVAPGRGGPLRDYRVQGGGVIGTALVAAARLGAYAELWSWVGDDAPGRLVLAELADEGVATQGVETRAGARTPLSFVQVDEETGERTIYHGPYLAVPAAQMAALAARKFEFDAVVVDAYWPEASARAAERARQAGIPVVGDLCPTEALSDLTGLITHLIAPKSCAERLAPDAAWETRLTALTAQGPRFAAVTVGDEGCYYLSGGKLSHQPPFSVPVVDTTGAGDAFHGAFAYALGKRWSEDRAVTLASAVGALTCRALGGRTAIPNLEETTAFLNMQSETNWE